MGFVDNGSLAGILSTPNSRGKIIVTQLLSIFIWLFVLMVCITVVGVLSASALFPCLVLLLFSILLSTIGCIWFTKKDFSL